MLRTSIVLASLVTSAFVSPAFSPEPHDEAPLAYTPAMHDEQRVSRFEYDASLLPAATGWFVVPLTAEGDARATIDLRFRDQDGDGAGDAASFILAAPGYPGIGMWGGHTWWAPDMVDVNHGGERVACCGLAGEMESGGGGMDEVYLRDGETLYVGFAAVGWGDEQDKIRIIVESYGAPLTEETVRTGETVVAVDLVEAAWRAGDNARVLGRRIVGGPGEADYTFTPDHTGLLTVRMHAQGDGAKGDLRVAAEGEPVFSHTVENAVAGYQLARAGGSFEVSLTKLADQAYDHTLPADDPAWLNAHLLYADVDIPLDGHFRYFQPVEEEW